MNLIKGSRFWTFTPPIVILSAFLAWHFDDPATFVNVTIVWMGGAGAKTTMDTFKNGKAKDTPEES